MRIGEINTSVQDPPVSKIIVLIDACVNNMLLVKCIPCEIKQSVSEKSLISIIKMSKMSDFGDFDAALIKQFRQVKQIAINRR